jgi:DUF4097 and DUF4098 domain-containing protein YvlB
MRIITIVCWLITAIVLIGLAIWFLTGSIFGIRSDWDSGLSIGGWETLTGPYEVAGVYTPGTEGINSLNIDWVAGDVTVKPYDGDNFQITEYAQRELQGNEKLYIYTSGGTLTVRYRESSTNLRMPQKKLEVLVPQALNENFNKFSADTVSGAVMIDRISADTLTINTMSGAIKIGNSNSQTLDIDTTSGSITVELIETGKVSMDSMSGSIRMSGATARTLTCATTSGSVDVAGAFDSVKFNSTSGRLSLENSASGSTIGADSTSGALDLSGSFNTVYTNTMSGSISVTSTIVPGQLNVDTTSGSITITIPDEGEVTVDHDSTSGGFSSAIPVKMQKQGAQFKISSMSGSTRILKLG